MMASKRELQTKVEKARKELDSLKNKRGKVVSARRKYLRDTISLCDMG